MSNSIKEIGAFEAKTKLSSILAQVEKGRSFYITRHGRRVAEVKPVTTRPPTRKFGSGMGTVLHMAPDFDAPLDDFRDYMP